MSIQGHERSIAFDASAGATRNEATAALETGMAAGERVRLRIEIEGVVQGVGFRPFVYRLATQLDLAGWVRNDARGVVVEIEGRPDAIGRFRHLLPVQAPARARLFHLATEWLPEAGETTFEIRESDETLPVSVPLLSDAATCSECLEDVATPGNRRYRYPFTNCTNCGPRYSIITSVPYDRPRTTMARFPMCRDCRAEYDDPADRRFHAQPLACPACGPRLALWSRDCTVIATGDEALRDAAEALRAGRIVAVKGLGGFQLMVDARSDHAVHLLRHRKARAEKPLALMVRDMAQARSICEVSPQAEEALRSPEAPILLLPRLAGACVAPSVAPGNPNLGLMLPTTPLHHLLLQEAGGPLVATSGNLSEEPICIDEPDALDRLAGIADLFLVHDRPIARPVDDSVAWIFRGELRVLRRARGFAPLPVASTEDLPVVLGVGGHLKNTVALGRGDRVLLSQHVGDLETPATVAAFERAIADLLNLYDVQPLAVAHDLHPDYLSTLWARSSGTTCVGVQHHHAHLAACLADNETVGPALGVTWDGAGYGTDGTIWGGEFLAGSAEGFTRVARLRPFPLVGGDFAAREPRRAALGILWELGGETLLGDASLAPVREFSAPARQLLVRAMSASRLYLHTSSAGRLFDAVASLLGIRQMNAFEGQAAMELEWAVDDSVREIYPFPLIEAAPADPADGAHRADVPRWELDWRPMLVAILEDLACEVPIGRIAARFHNALAEGITAVARVAGERRVALTGGCFLNRRLASLAADRLAGAGFDVLLHRQVPPGDGGIALGQVMVAAAALRRASGGKP